MSRFALLLFALVVLIPAVWAQTCSGVAQGDYGTCYGLRASCHYDPISGICLTGAPQNCSQFTADFVGCGLNANCSFKSYVNGQTINFCSDTGQLCSSINNAGACGYRHDCQWTGSACQLQPTITSCALNTNSAQCSAFGCVWDWFLGKCYDNLAEISAAYTCSSWSNAPSPNGACAFHSCYLSGSVCLTVNNGSQNPNNYVVVDSFSDFIGNPTLTANSLSFGFQVISPFTFTLSTPMHLFITIGRFGFGQINTVGAVGFGQQNLLNPSTICNDIGTLTPYPFVMTWPYLPTNYPVSALQNYVVGWVNSGHNMSFPLGDPYGYQAFQMFGNVSVGAHSLITSVSIDSSNSSWIFNGQIDMGQMVNNCTIPNLSLNPSLTTGQSSQQYVVPISVLRQDVNNAWYETTAIFYVTIQSTGLVAVSATSQYQYNAFVSVGSQFPTTGCSAGSAQMIFGVTLQYNNIYDSSLSICPRNCSDIYFNVSGLTNGLTNGYGDFCVNVTAPVCVGQSCACQVTIETACKVLTSDGKAFLYVYNSSYTSALDQVHSFFVSPYQWTTGQSNYQLVVQSPQGLPDPVSLVYGQLAYPTSGTQVILPVFDIDIGYLATPTVANFSTFVTLASVINGTTVYPTTSDNFNAELDLNTPFVLAIRARDPRVQSTVALSIVNNASFTWFALDAVGNRIAQYPYPVNFTNLRPYFSYLDKIQAATCVGVGCSVLPILSLGLGIDGFAILPSFIRSIVPGNGYQITIPYSFDLSTYDPNNFGGHGRRLLQVPGGEGTQASSGHFTVTVKFTTTVQVGNTTEEVSGNTTVTFPVQGALLGLGSTGAETRNSLLEIFMGATGVYIIAFGLGMWVFTPSAAS
jgi:hypothetical protein